MKKLTKSEAENYIKEFFKTKRSQEEIKKIKRLTMHHNIKLGEYRKNFCKKCFSQFPKNALIRIKNKIKIIRCKNCGCVSRWKI